MSDHPSKQEASPADARMHEMNPTGRFSDRVRDYVRHRPSYPPAAIDAILHGLGDAPLTIADIGAGTGISARLFADRGHRVLAVEPNAEMRAGAAPHELVEYRDGRAEATGLSSRAVELVVCAQAFHWFEPAGAFAEFHRILKPAGRVALMWNDRDDADPVTAEYGRLIRRASGNHRAAEDLARSGEALAASPHFRGARVMQFRNEQLLDEPGLVGRALSASYVPRDGPLLDALVDGLRSLHARARATQNPDVAGRIALVYSTRVFLAEPT